jgi:hypothetical protein
VFPYGVAILTTALRVWDQLQEGASGDKIGSGLLLGTYLQTQLSVPEVSLDRFLSVQLLRDTWLVQFCARNVPRHRGLSILFMCQAIAASSSRFPIPSVQLRCLSSRVPKTKRSPQGQLLESCTTRSSNGETKAIDPGVANDRDISESTPIVITIKQYAYIDPTSPRQSIAMRNPPWNQHRHWGFDLTFFVLDSYRRLQPF